MELFMHTPWNMGLSGEGSAGSGSPELPVLQNKIVAVWTLTANVNDGSPNAYTLTNNNSVTFGANGAHFDPQAEAMVNEYLSRASNSNLQTGDTDWAGVFRFRVDDLDEYYSPIGKSSNLDTEWSVDIDIFTDDRLIFYVRVTDEELFSETVRAANAPAIEIATEYFVFISHNAATSTLTIQVDDNTPDTAVLQSVAVANTEAFGIGSRPGGDYSGDVKYVALWKGTDALTALDAAARTWLRTTWNGTYTGLSAYSS